MIHLQDVSVTYPSGTRALSHVDLHIERGAFCFIVGASGSGKSTLMQLIYREIAPDGGRVILDGQDVAQLPPAKVPYLRRKMGIVFQDFRLLPDMTVWENVGFALDVLGASRREKYRKVPITLELVGLTDEAPAATGADLHAGSADSAVGAWLRLQCGARGVLRASLHTAFASDAAVREDLQLGARRDRFRVLAPGT